MDPVFVGSLMLIFCSSLFFSMADKDMSVPLARRLYLFVSIAVLGILVPYTDWAKLAQLGAATVSGQLLKNVADAAGIAPSAQRKLA